MDHRTSPGEEARSTTGRQRLEQGRQISSTPTLKDAAEFVDAVGMLSNTVGPTRFAISNPRGVKRTLSDVASEPGMQVHSFTSSTSSTSSKSTGAARRERRTASVCSGKIIGVGTDEFKAKVAKPLRCTLLMLDLSLGPELALAVRAFIERCGIVPTKWLKIFQHNTNAMLDALSDHKCSFFGKALSAIEYTPNVQLPVAAIVAEQVSIGTDGTVPTITEQLRIVGAAGILDRRVQSLERTLHALSESVSRARREAHLARAESLECKNRLRLFGQVVRALETGIRTLDCKVQKFETTTSEMAKDVDGLKQEQQNSRGESVSRNDFDALKGKVHESILSDIGRLKMFAVEMSEFANQVIDNEGKIADVINGDVFEAANGYTIKIE